MASFGDWRRVPLAEAIGLSFIAPLIALYLAAVLLGESVGRRAIIASLLGLAGVLVIVSGKLGASYDREATWGVVAVLFSATLYAYNLVLQRQQAQVASPIDIAFFQNMIVGAIYLSLAPFLAEVPELHYWPTIVAAGVLAVCSVLVLSWGYARAEAQYLVSLEYSGFVWAVIFGWGLLRRAPHLEHAGGHLPDHHGLSHRQSFERRRDQRRRR